MRSALWPLVLVLSFCSPVFALPGGGSTGAAGETYGARAQDVPPYAREMFAYVMDNGRAPRHYVGGRVWQNREHRLPSGGDYREYDVHPKIRGVNRGPERIIVDRQAGKGWYTPDHYRTFIRIGAK